MLSNFSVKSFQTKKLSEDNSMQQNVDCEMWLVECEYGICISNVQDIPALNDFSDGSLQLLDSVLDGVEVLIDLSCLRVDLCVGHTLPGQRLKEAGRHCKFLETTHFITKGLTLSLESQINVHVHNM